MLQDKLKEYRVILASASPRRKELLTALGIEYELFTAFNLEEEFPKDMEPREVPLFLAKEKSLAYPYDLMRKEILITADTIVSLDSEVLLKPNSHSDAFEILRKLSARSHYVYTGVYIRSDSDSVGFVSETEVVFGKLSDDEIEYYIQNYKPFDKAGAYGIQEWIGYVGVEQIRGSYFNVMGLPIYKLYRELEVFISKVL